jgi:hypothetical protein
LSLKALGNNYSTFLDKNNFNKFLEFNQINCENSVNNLNFFLNFISFKKLFFSKNNSNYNIVLPFFFENQTNTNPIYNILNKYSTLIENLNNDSDKKFFNYPLRKVFNKFFYFSNLNKIISNKSTSNINFLGNKSQNLAALSYLNNNSTLKIKTLQSANQGFLPSDQNLRQYKNLLPNLNNFNFSNHHNSISQTYLKNLNFDKLYNLSKVN